MEEPSCKEVMAKAGKCIDRMAERGYRKKEAGLCVHIANALYFICLRIARASREQAENQDTGHRENMLNHALEALARVCDDYANTQDEGRLEGPVEGMSAMWILEQAKSSYSHACKTTFSQAVRESSTIYLRRPTDQ